MRTPMNRAARTYLRRVSRLMCCSGEEKRTRLQGLRESILEASAAGQPFETPDQVAAHFGAPEAMAEELLESLLQPPQIRRTLLGAERPDLQPGLFQQAVPFPPGAGEVPGHPAQVNTLWITVHRIFLSESSDSLGIEAEVA